MTGGRAEGVHAARLRVGAGVAAPASRADLVGLAAAVCVAGADGGLDAPVVLALLVPGAVPVPVALLRLAALVGVPVVPAIRKRSDDSNQFVTFLLFISNWIMGMSFSDLTMDTVLVVAAVIPAVCISSIQELTLTQCKE